MASRSPYLIENGFRRVKPYYYDFATTVKERWKCKSVSHVLTHELGQNPLLVELGISNGSIYVTTDTNKTCEGVKLLPRQTQMHLFRDHDVLHNRQHMHEPPIIYSGPVPVLMENDDLVVVSKPLGMPTHPSGSYRLNSLSHILKEEQGFLFLSPCHRLDKATSGILVLAKNSQAGSKFQKVFNDKRNTEKWYLARVKGKFPAHKFVFESPVFSLSFGGYLNLRNTNQVPVDSSTEFELLKYSLSLDESIISCKAITGKMHQIRIHLRCLGHPIVNDYLYNPSPDNVVGTFKNELELEIYEKAKEKFTTSKKTLDLDALLQEHPSIKDSMSKLRSLRKETDDRELLGVCSECFRKLYDDPTDEEIYLHAQRLRHKGDINFDLQSEMPQWADI